MVTQYIVNIHYTRVYTCTYLTAPTMDMTIVPSTMPLCEEKTDAQRLASLAAPS